MEKIKVLLVDDHQIVVDGYASLLGHEPGIEVTGKALNGTQALNLINETRPDIVVVDLELEEGFDGIELLKLVSENHPGIRLLVLSMYKTDAHITGVLGAGASGYIVKNRGIEELVGAIKLVHQGKTYYSDEVTEAIMESYRNPKVEEKPKGSDIQLTKREKEVLRLIVAEMTGPEIADKLCIAPSTVETHRRNIIEKAGIKSKGLMRFGLESGLLDDE